MTSDASPTRSEDPFELSDEVVLAVAELRPMMATLWGIPGHEGDWDDLSPEGHAQVHARLKEFERRLPPQRPDAPRWSKLAAEVLSDFLRLELDRYEHDDPLTDLNNIASPFQLIRIVFDVMDASSEAAWEARVRRLETLGDVLEGYRRSLDEGIRRGQSVAARQVRTVIEQGRLCAGEQSYFRSLPTAMDRAGVRDGALQKRLAAGAFGACSAFGQFVEWLEHAYLPSARAEDAVGRARYLREAGRFLGTEIDPEETYAWGFREVASIGGRMRELANRIAPGKTILEVLGLLQTDPTRSPPDIDAFLELMRERQQVALSQLSGTHFDLPPEVRNLEVKLAPLGGPLGAYYAPPSDGFARPGCVWYSPGEAKTLPLFDQIATAYHEGFPGHHLQIGIQIALTERLSRLHRVADGYAGFAEGWALYAEELMAELGYYEKPEYLFGMLSCQMVRACRVVIDIGSHLTLPIPSDQPFHPGEAWSFDTGVEMLTTLGGLSPSRAASEMTRYLGWPGQAISYKVGQRVFLDLRERERDRLGASFDLKDFHGRVLGCGNVGLDHLKRLVVEKGA